MQADIAHIQLSLHWMYKSGETQQKSVHDLVCL
jgi:hypothetical protein